MAQRRTIGNIVAPWRFLLFLAVFVAGIPVAIAKLHNSWLGLMTAFDIAAALFLLVCAPLIASARSNPRE
jgi:apolipoprotein N-acyltransferase